MTELDEITLKAHASIAEITQADWDCCSTPDDNPFISHDFLSALEQSGSAIADTGWAPTHLAAYGHGGQLVGAVPCYLKNHSQGEYVFDHAWAEALHQAGRPYYPKLQVGVPFTPVTGPRLLVRPGVDHARISGLLIAGLKQLTRRYRASSCHLTFLSENQSRLLTENGFLQRTGQQFQWRNQAYGSFDDFLNALSARKRKSIKKERKQVAASGIEIQWLTGSDLCEQHWDAFFECYQFTSISKWGVPYLSREFFSLVSQRMADKILLILCRRSGKTIAGALNFIGTNTLFGRNWGALENHPYLHFEACYYQAMDFAIEKGLASIEAGAQGTHKLARGYLPVTTWSSHYIPDTDFSTAVEDYLDQERLLIAHDIEILSAHSPFRKQKTE